MTKERTDWDERENTGRRKRLDGGQAGHPGLEGLLRLRRVPLSGTRLGGFPGGGTRRGILKRKIIDTSILSRHHSSFERFFYWIESMHSRLGKGSWRSYIPPNNAAPDAFSEFYLSQGGRTLYIIDSDFKVDVLEGCIYHYDRRLNEMEIVSRTIVYQVSIFCNRETQTEVVRLIYEWQGK